MLQSPRGLPHSDYTRRIDGFDGLRAIAALMVVANHKTAIAQEFNIYSGSYGVTLFFILSGFLIVNILRNYKYNIDMGVGVYNDYIYNFYLNRLLRIWPPYFLTIAFAFTMGVIGIWNPLTPSELAGSLTFTMNVFQAYYWADYPEHIGALWSIAIEEQFYLWAAPVFLLSPRRYFPAICMIVIVIAGLSVPLNWLLGLPSRAIYVGSAVNFGFMALGGLCSIAIRPSPIYARAAPFALIAFLLLPIAASHYPTNGLPALLLRASTAPIVAVLLLGIVSDQKSLLVRALSLKPLVYVGQISYGLYLYHGLVDLRPLPIEPLWLGLVETLIAFAAAALSWRYMERPLIGLKGRLRREPSASAPASSRAKGERS